MCQTVSQVLGCTEVLICIVAHVNFSFLFFGFDFIIIVLCLTFEIQLHNTFCRNV